MLVRLGEILGSHPHNVFVKQAVKHVLDVRLLLLRDISNDTLHKRADITNSASQCAVLTSTLDCLTPASLTIVSSTDLL